MEIKTREEASEYLDRLIAWHMDARPEATFEEAEKIEKDNLGYYAGYYEHEVRIRVEDLFQCKHPIFKAAKEGLLTAQECFDAGVMAAMKAKLKELPY